MKRTKAILSRPSKADLAMMRERLEYIYFTRRGMAKDFRSPRERAAIASRYQVAVLERPICVEAQNGQYSTTMMSKTVPRDGPHDGVLLDTEALRRAEKVLLPPKPRK